MTELDGIPGFYRVSRDEAKLLIQPVIGTDGYYLLRPTDDPRAICTICVTIRQKLMNYKLMQETLTQLFYVRDNCKFPTISALIHHYQQYPLNPDVKTRLLFPVKADQGDEYVALEPARDPPPIVTRTQTYGGPAPPLPNRTRPMSGDRMRPPLPEPTPTLPDPRRNRTLPPPGRRDSAHQEQNKPSNGESIETLPGVHVDLPKQHVPVILSAFSDRDSSYLVRPSASSKGQFTISLICETSILNFKINCEPTTGMYFVTPRKKYQTVRELLETHRTVPLKSKARQGAKIYLLHPITTQEILQALNTIKQNQPLPSPTSPAPLPPPWKEFFDKNHKRPYFYNPDTRQTVWERPKAVESKASRLQKASTLDSRNGPRPLPNVPEEPISNKPRLSLDSNIGGARIGMGKSPNRSMDRRGLPNLPPKSPSVNKQDATPPFGDTPPRSVKSERQLPGLPPKEGSPGPRGSVPKLPPKEISRDTPLPPLPPKDATPFPPLPEKVPSLPNKEPPSPLSYNAPPTLPPKDRTLSSSLPPLPPKDLSQTTPTISLPPLPPKDSSSDAPEGHTHRLPRERPTEYEDTIFPSPNTQRSMAAPLPPPISLNSIPAPPPMPEMGVSTPPLGPGGGPPPPPPIPPEGIPCPPPPPPAMMPSPSLNVERRPKQGGRPPPDPEPSSEGRPFSANDLLLQKNRLKAKKDEDLIPRQKTGSFLENTLSSAIELRLGSIRNAVEDDSDDDTDVEEIDDDDEWN